VSSSRYPFTAAGGPFQRREYAVSWKTMSGPWSDLSFAVSPRSRAEAYAPASLRLRAVVSLAVSLDLSADGGLRPLPSA